MVVAERDFAERNGLQPLARLVAYGVAAVEPGLFGIGPVPRCGRRWSVRAGSWATLNGWSNEAFAAVPSRSARTRPGEDIVNVEGGAIAHGHPIGATGAVLTTRLLHSMQRDGLKRGLVTLCIGEGRGSRLRSRQFRDRDPVAGQQGDFEMPLAKIHVLEGRYDEHRLANVPKAVQEALISILKDSP